MSHALQTLRAHALTLTGVALLSLLSACGGSGADAPPANVANKGTLQPMGSDDALVAQVKAMLASGAQRVVSVNAETLAAGPTPTALTIGGTTSTTAPAFSTTTRQEAAVDEDDFVKTDGRSVYTFKRRPADTSIVGPQFPNQIHDVQVHRRASDGSVALLQTAALTKADDYEALQGMHLRARCQALGGPAPRQRFGRIALPPQRGLLGGGRERSCHDHPGSVECQ